MESGKFAFIKQEQKSSFSGLPPLSQETNAVIKNKFSPISAHKAASRVIFNHSSIPTRNYVQDLGKILEFIVKDFSMDMPTMSAYFSQIGIDNKEKIFAEMVSLPIDSINYTDAEIEDSCPFPPRTLVLTLKWIGSNKSKIVNRFTREVDWDHFVVPKIKKVSADTNAYVSVFNFRIEQVNMIEVFDWGFEISSKKLNFCAFRGSENKRYISVSHPNISCLVENSDVKAVRLSQKTALRRYYWNFDENEDIEFDSILDDLSKSERIKEKDHADVGQFKNVELDI